MPWKFLFLSLILELSLKSYGSLWALLFLSLCGILLTGSWGVEGGSLVEQKSFETLIWEEDMVKLCFVKNLELLGLENMLKTCLSVKGENIWRLFLFQKTTLKLCGCSSGESINMSRLLNKQTRARI